MGLKQMHPLLFEPDNAVNFGLLIYQEKLKGLYQGKRTELDIIHWRISGHNV